MNRLISLYVAAFLFLLPALNFAHNDNNQAEVQYYIDIYKDIAIDEMMRTGIPASIKLAQAVLESNAGRSYLAVQGNNHFGMKCGKYWDGEAVMREDDDYKHGKLVKSCFRSYPNAAFSFVAHSEFLLDPKKEYRYGFLFDLPPTDYQAWARGLKKAGYATDPKYPTRLITIIERYHLFQYDLPPLAVVAQEIIKEDVTTYEERITSSPENTKVDQPKPEQQAAKLPEKKIKPSSDAFFAGVSTSYITHVNNGVKYIEAVHGDQLMTIALETGTDVDDLVEFNDHVFSSSQTIPAETIIYIEAKKSKYSGTRTTYRASKGERVSDIAQKFGICSSKLMKRNKWEKGYQPRGGELVYLKGKKRT